MSYRKFEELLKSTNKTAYKVATDTKIAPSTFADWKKGRSTPKADKLQTLADYFGVSITYFLSDSVREESARYSLVPIIGEIRAGSPIITNETLLGHESAEVSDADEYFYLEIRGDSMKNIGMVNGSVVLFHKQQYAEDGEIVACLVDGDSATVKRFIKTKKSITLMPENEDYSPINLTPEDFESGDARILGVAKEVKIKL